jgi:hypothetical protein
VTTMSSDDIFNHRSFRGERAEDQRQVVGKAVLPRPRMTGGAREVGSQRRRRGGPEGAR